MQTATMIATLISLLLAIAACLDVWRFIIPNWLNGLLLLLYPAMLFLTPEGHQVDWLHGLYAFGGVFVLGYLIFAFGVMGGGDIKLLCVLALWTGLTRALLNFVVFSALLGGLLTLLLLALRFTMPMLLSRRAKTGTVPRVLTHGEPLPYGLALAAGFLIVLWTGHVPGLTGIDKPLRPLIHRLESYVT